MNLRAQLWYTIAMSAIASVVRAMSAAADPSRGAELCASVGASVKAEDDVVECEVEARDSFQAFRVVDKAVDSQPATRFRLNERLVLWRFDDPERARQDFMAKWNVLSSCPKLAGEPREIESTSADRLVRLRISDSLSVRMSLRTDDRPRIRLAVTRWD